MRQNNLKFTTWYLVFRKTLPTEQGLQKSTFFSPNLSLKNCLVAKTRPKTCCGLHGVVLKFKKGNW